MLQETTFGKSPGALVLYDLLKNDYLPATKVSRFLCQTNNLFNDCLLVNNKVKFLEIVMVDSIRRLQEMTGISYEVFHYTKNVLTRNFRRKLSNAKAKKCLTPR